MTGRYLEDLAVGEINTSPEVSASETDIIDFARATRWNQISFFKRLVK